MKNMHLGGHSWTLVTSWIGCNPLIVSYSDCLLGSLT